ncbi:MAG: TonB-dependent receptor [Tannerella sp.]|jgi:hypothetical protein|nr:TonB-dependent receptor [Tannerella sp.]
MKQNKIKTLVIIALLGGFTAVNAQNEDEKLNREMTLEREYDPTVQDASKVNRLPEIKEPAITKQSINYSPFTVPADPQKEINILSSGNAMTEIPYNKRRGYFQFGGGMYTNLSGDLGYNILNDHKNLLNIFASHRSTNGKLKYEEYWGDEKQKAKLTDNLIGLNFNHYFDQGAIIRLGGKYSYTAFNYYGYSYNRIPSVSSIWEPDSFDHKTNQVNQLINGYAGVKSKEGSMIGYLVDIEYNRFTQKYGWTTDMDGIQENKITIQAGVSGRFGNNNNQSAGLFAKVNYFNYKYPTTNLYPGSNIGDSLGYQNYMEATISPYYQMQGDGWKVKLGVNAMIITGDSSKFFASPNISAEAEIADKTVFYLDATGEIQSNDAYSISLQNRYVDHMPLVLPSRTWLDATLGIRSGVAPGFWFDVFAGYKITDNEVFFIPGIPMENNDFGSYQYVFQPNASLFRIGASLKYEYQKWMDLSIKGVYNNWSLKKGDNNIEWDDMKPYGRPTTEINADLTVRPISPLALNFNYYLGASRYSYLLLDKSEVKLDNINDLNFMATWNFTDMIGAYIKLNNIISQHQEFYYGYPLQKFNAMAGININF